MKVLYFFAIFFTIAHAKSADEKERVIDRKLSEKEHYRDNVHNPEYDSEAFLGDEVESFRNIDFMEGKKKLGLIFDKIDENKDGAVSQEELKNYIRLTQKKFIIKDIDSQWHSYNVDGHPTISWDSYQNAVYGFLDHMDPAEVENEDNNTYKKMMKRDRRRWLMADKNSDDELTKEEFGRFLHPEEDEYMKDVIIEETMEDIDKDGDGRVSLKEYIGDMYPGDEGEAPDWVGSEKEQFSTYRDKDGDGFMDVEEIKNWILPPDFDHAEAEARHLIYESDTDADEQLTKEEMIKKYDLFVGSQVTNFGDDFKHDEL